MTRKSAAGENGYQLVGKVAVDRNYLLFWAFGSNCSLLQLSAAVLPHFVVPILRWPARPKSVLRSIDQPAGTILSSVVVISDKRDKSPLLPCHSNILQAGRRRTSRVAMISRAALLHMKCSSMAS
jgi:hypothetical protein